MARRPQPKQTERPVYSAIAAGANCRLCPLSRTCKPVAPRLVPGAKLVAVEGWPSRSEDERGTPTRHPASELLKKNLAAANVEEYGYTWALLCRPPKGTPKKDIQDAISCCAPRLQRDVAPEQVDSSGGVGERRWVLSLGAEAFRAVTGKLDDISAWIGAPINTQWPGIRAVPTYSPGFILKPDGSRYAAIFGIHTWRAAHLSDGRLPDWEWGHIVISEPLEALAEIARRVFCGEPYSMDIEADGKGMAPERRITCIGFAVEGLAVSVRLPFESRDVEDLVRGILANGTMWTQNGLAYDVPMLKARGFDVTSDVHDCLLAAAILDPQIERNLGFLASSEFHSEAHKQEYRQNRSPWDTEDPEEIRQLLTYNAKDAAVTLLVGMRQLQRLAEYV